jgi:secondary thiamine-phosphate synthase enzyme
MIKELFEIRTERKIEMLSIAHEVRGFVNKHKIHNGRIGIFIPHTTAGVTMNENADPSVQYDLNKAMEDIFPETLNVMHDEGNTSAHLMSSIIGANLTVFVDNGKPLLGTWQGIYFWEFDGPRTRNYYIIYDN